MRSLKQLSFSVFTGLILFSCNSKNKVEVQYETFGEAFTSDESVLTAEQMGSTFDSLEIGDTSSVVFETKIDAVCQKKGCWMDVYLANDEVARVTFLDYGFFVPLNSAKSTALVKGKAFWKADTAAEKLHYAEDAGEDVNEDEIDLEEYTPHIVATGVMIKK